MDFSLDVRFENIIAGMVGAFVILRKVRTTSTMDKVDLQCSFLFSFLFLSLELVFIGFKCNLSTMES